MRAGLVAALLALALPVSASAASFQLPYTLTLHGTGRITGTFGGVSVLGTFEGTGTEGVFTLTVDGKAFVMGIYQCVPVECAIVGEEVLGQSKSFLILTRSMGGTIRGSLPQLYPAHAAWIKAVEKWGKENLQTMPLEELVAAAARLRAGTSNGFSS